MRKSIFFQDSVIRLNSFWADHDCLIWQPCNTEVGAGTMNPATFLRVLGSDPWRVGYVEPSVRPDDSRYGAESKPAANAHSVSGDPEA